MTGQRRLETETTSATLPHPSPPSQGEGWVLPAPALAASPAGLAVGHRSLARAENGSSATLPWGWSSLLHPGEMRALHPHPLLQPWRGEPRASSFHLPAQGQRTRGWGSALRCPAREQRQLRRPGTSLPSPGDIKQTPRVHSAFVSPAGHPRFDLQPSAAGGKIRCEGFGSGPCCWPRGELLPAAGRAPRSSAQHTKAPLKGAVLPLLSFPRASSS